MKSLSLLSFEFAKLVTACNRSIVQFGAPSEAQLRARGHVFKSLETTPTLNKNGPYGIKKGNVCAVSGLYAIFSVSVPLPQGLVCHTVLILTVA